MNKPIFRATNLHFATSERKILDGISISLKEGEIHGLLGPNGAGKTTAFYIICGLIRPLSGEVWLDGVDLSGLDLSQRARLGLGYMAQERTLFPAMSVQDNILSALELRSDLNRQARLSELERIMDQLSITKLAKTKANQLSGGEARRTEVARILACKPKILLMDEPFAGVDPIAISEIHSLIHQLSEMGISTLITDHNAREILSLCHQTTVIAGGRLIAKGSKEEITQHELVNRYYLNNQYSDLV